MNVCLIGPTYPFRGGISHYTTLLHAHLRSRHRVRFISFKRQYPKGLFPGKSDRDPSRRPLRVEGVSRVIDSMNPATWVRAAALVVREAPDLVIIPWWVSFWAPQFWTIAAITRGFGSSNIMFLCHNVIEHESLGIDRALTKMVLRLGHCHIVHSEEDRLALAEMLPAARILKSPHPTYDVFDSGHSDPERVRRMCGLKGRVILFFGFVRKYKGLQYLIHAFPEVLSEVDASLLVVGEFWKDKPEYLRMVDALGIRDRVAFVDRYVPNEEVGDYFAAADLVVQPYTSATGSGVIQIAFGFGTPVVATRVGCLTEMIEDGKTGFLVRPKDSGEIARAILRFFHENRAEEFRNHIHAAHRRFSWDRMVDVIEIGNSLVSPKPGETP